MSHFCFVEHQNLRITLQKGFSFWGTLLLFWGRPLQGYYCGTPCPPLCKS